ncbi:serine/threonine-protein kinase [Variovorax sp. YR752]|uniref:serine/threonine-protein kinase n=1 Tax=Variovorax sp. YR752 TaxID=1884383 RepID=UPI0031380F0D
MDANTLQRLVRLSPRLDELLELDPTGQRRYLERLRADDAALADELATLLARQTDIEREGFLEGGPAELPGATLAGQRLGAYTLVAPLGAGGMGSVWLARRSDGRFDGEVALKLLNMALIGGGGAARFAREAQALARLDHPNIARLLDAGVGASGQPYLVIERVDGTAITRWCDERSLGVAARLALLIEVLAAVEHAHQRLVLHRDLKPDNILVTPEGRVKLLDFGIAKLLDDPAQPAAPSALTQQAGRAFTPDYAAPEQVQGGEVTTATDVYALGVLLHELLGGGHPTAREGDSAVQRLRAVVEREPRRLSDAVATPSQARALRGDLDNIVARALKKSPAERYAGAAALADDLRRHLAHQPVAARPDGWAYRSARFVRRHRVAVAAAGVSVAALMAGVVGTAWQAIEAGHERDEALFQARRAQAKSNLMNLALNLTDSPDQPLTLREVLERSVRLAEQQFGDDPRIAVDLLVTLAGQYEHAGDAAMDATLMARAEAIARASGDPLLLADVACNRVSTELGLGRIDAAREQLRQGLAAMAQVQRPAVLSAVACQRAEAEQARAEGDLPRAIERVGAGIANIEKRGDRSGPQYAVLLGFLGQLLADHGELARAYAVHQRLADLDARLGRSDSRGDLRNRRAMATILLDWGEPREAMALLDAIAPRVRDIAPGAAPPDWLELPRAMALTRLASLAEAEAALRATADRARASGAQKSAARADYLLAQVLVAQRRHAEADALLDRLASRLDTVQRQITPAALRAAIRLGQGRVDEGRALIDAELRRLGHPGAITGIAGANALRTAARVQLAAGDAAQAEALARAAQAAAERIARAPARSADVGEATLLIAQACRGRGAAAEAMAAATQAAAVLKASLGEAHPLTREAQALASP